MLRESLKLPIHTENSEEYIDRIKKVIDSKIDINIKADNTPAVRKLLFEYGYLVIPEIEGIKGRYIVFNPTDKYCLSICSE